MKAKNTSSAPKVLVKEARKQLTFTEIDGISGATISVNAIKKGVQKLTLLFNHIQLEDL